MAMETEVSNDMGMVADSGAGVVDGGGGDDAAVYPPGSEEARARGCTCPISDNGRGKGILGGILIDGKPQYVYSSDCTVHPLGAGSFEID